MEDIKIIYEIYNNSDFTKICFASSRKEAEKIVKELEKLNHVSKVKIVN